MSALVLERVRVERGGRTLLRAADASFAGGRCAAVTGGSGAGKTTLLRLLNRFAEPDGGRILLDGRPIRELDVLALRRQVVLVPQRPTLLTEFVRDELRVGRAVDDTRAALRDRGVAFGSAITLGALLVLGIVSTQARVVVPVGGMIVSSAMQATGVALRRLREDAHGARAAVEARLALGLPGREAFLPHRRSALRTALLPAIDGTKVVGLISLPGAMTGLILAGVDPLTAIRYQIVVMYMLLAATTLAALAATRAAERTLFDDAHRLITLPGE